MNSRVIFIKKQINEVVHSLAKVAPYLSSFRIFITQSIDPK